MRLNLESDKNLVSLYTTGNQGAFNELMQRHQSRVYAKIYQYVRDRDLALDLYQDTFLKAVQALQDGQYNEEGKFSAWIMRIAHNLCIDHFRNAKKIPVQRATDTYDPLNFVPELSKNVEQSMAKKEIHADVKRIIALLPKEQKEIVLMRMVYDMSFKEIADQLDISINTALGRMRYALINLRKYVVKYNIELTV